MPVPWRKKNSKKVVKEEEPLPRKVLEIRGEGPDPDEDLADDAGFEVGVEKTPKAGILGRFKPEDRSFTVAAVDGSPTKETVMTSAIGSDAGVTEKDEEGIHSCEETTTNTTKDRLTSMRSHRMFPWALLVCLLLFIGLIVGLVVGLSNNDDDNKIQASDVTIQTAAPIVNVLIDFDDNPQEVTWSMMDKGTWVLLASEPEGGYNASATFINEAVTLEWNKDYVFRIADTGADGFSSSTTVGKWLLVYNGTEFASRSGNWGSEDSVTFAMNSQMGGPQVIE